MPGPPNSFVRLAVCLAFVAAPTSMLGGEEPTSDESPADSVAAADESPVEIDLERAAACTLEFTNGDRLRGDAIAVVNGAVHWRLDSGDVVVFPLASVARIERVDGTAAWAPEIGNPDVLFGGGDEPFVTPEIALELEFPEEEEPLETASLDLLLHEPVVVFRQAAALTHRIEIGGQFIDGNSESDSLNLLGKFKYEDDRRKADLEFGGFLGSADGIFATNRWFANGTVDFNRPDSARWLVFLTSRNEYDQFQNLDYRGTLSAGLGYRFVKQPDRSLVVRFGPGVTGELYRNPYRKQINPDLFGQIEAKWPLYDRLVYEHNTTVIPAVDDFEIVRIVSKNGLLLPLDEDERWNLKIGFQFDYNSRPNANRVPTDYTTTLVLVYNRKK